MSNRGWILAFRASQSSQARYLFEKSKSSADKDAEMLRSKGFEILNVYQSQQDCNVITKEEI